MEERTTFLKQHFLNQEITIYIEDREKGIIGRSIFLIDSDEKFLYVKNEKNLAEAIDKNKVIRMVNKKEGE